jgi:four helix bundle protein
VAKSHGFGRGNLSSNCKVPANEAYCLTSQMRRCAISIPSNIAEGKSRKTRKDYTQFLHIADGSASELETQILIAGRLYPKIDFSKATGLLDEIQRMLSVLIKKLSST